MAAWTNVSFASGSILTSTKMDQVQANFTALAEGASGAPTVLAAALNQVAGAEAVTTECIRAQNVTFNKLSVSGWNPN
jgi:hypothetical protein